MERTHETIDFVPTHDQQQEGHAARVRTWLEQHVPFLNERGAADLKAYEGGRLSLNLYGYLHCEDADPHGVQCETTLAVEPDTGSSERFEDPNGDWWTRKRMVANASWYSGGLRSKPARLRADCIVKTVELAEAFDAAFSDDYVWSRGPTKAERERTALEWKRDAARIKVAAHVKEAIHTTCRLMRVGDERFIPAPEGVLLPGDYEVEVERKTYKVTVRDESALARFQFKRTK